MRVKDYLASASPLHGLACEGKIPELLLALAHEQRGHKLFCDPYGFSPLELAALLGRRHSSPLPTIKVLKQGEHILTSMDPARMLQEMGVAYSPTLRFSDLATFLSVVEKAPLLLGHEASNLGETHRDKVMAGWVAKNSIVWIDSVWRYGLRSSHALRAGDFVGAYTGVLRRVLRSYPLLNAYCVHYPTRYFSNEYYVIDARFYGNELRYINHSDTPNLSARWAYDRGLLHLLFFAIKDVPRCSFMSIDYGEDFWN